CEGGGLHRLPEALRCRPRKRTGPPPLQPGPPRDPRRPPTPSSPSAPPRLRPRTWTGPPRSGTGPPQDGTSPSRGCVRRGARAATRPWRCQLSSRRQLCGRARRGSRQARLGTATRGGTRPWPRRRWRGALPPFHRFPCEPRPRPATGTDGAPRKKSEFPIREPEFPIREFPPWWRSRQGSARSLPIR
ncbi:hypothetical protein T484DRAFT_1915202, partial [Baffinella frigidus]